MNTKRSIINVLDANTINQIAAGEVIERPASIVKELIENAIDAQATRVVIDFQEGGKKRIRVSDNGTGIVREDFSKIFLRHSTSKISSASDLSGIASLGFRGEAMASIAAVSDVQLISKAASEEMGHYIQVKGGRQVDFHPAGSNQGTQIIVEDLFFNTPVRKKFLKSIQVESGRIYDVVKRTALSFPEVSFECIRDGRQIFYSSGNGRLEDILLDLQGSQYFDQLFALDETKDGLRIRGYLSEPNASRGNRNHQYFFLNHRYISSRLLQFALEDAYGGFMMKGRFPIAILSIEVDPVRIDVNVHPTKLEVRFQDEKGIRETITHLLRQALRVHNQPQSWHFEDQEPKAAVEHLLEIQADQPMASQLADQIARYAVEEEDADQLDLNSHIEEVKHEAMPGVGAEEELANRNVTYSRNGSVPAVDQPLLKEEPPAPFAYPTVMIDVLFGTYILAKSTMPEALYLIDQHAAHERVLYEAFLSGAMQRKDQAQQLLQPEVIPLNAVEFDLVEGLLDLFMDFGMEVEILGEQTIVVRSMPNRLKLSNPQDFFLRFLDEMGRLSKGDLSKDQEAAVAKAACKAAVKAGDRLTVEEVEGLFDALQACRDPFHCPHGRPTMIRLSQAELEKKFGRRL